MSGHKTITGAQHPGPRSECDRCVDDYRRARAGPRFTGGTVPEPVTKAICTPDCDWLTTRTHHDDCVT